MIKHDQFVERYLFPFEVDGQCLEDVQSIGHLYRGKLQECQSKEELLSLTEQFEFFAWDAQQVAKTMTDEDFLRLKLSMTPNARVSFSEETLAKLAPLHLPKVMLHAYLIATEFIVPEYVAGFQYVRSLLLENEKGVDPFCGSEDNTSVPASGMIRET